MTRKKGRQCEEALEDGRQCQAHALTEERRTELDLTEDDPWLCRIHQLAASGDLSAVQRRAALANSSKRRGDVEASHVLSGLNPHVSLAEVLEVVRPALAAKLPTGEADYSARLCSAGILLAAFPRFLRDSPERVNELLRQAIPSEVYDERMNADTVYRNMRHEWDQLDGLGWSDLKGLVVRPYPPFMVGPHEDAVRIQRSRPQPDKSLRSRVRRLPNGRHVLDHDGGFPLLLDRVEDDGGLIRV